MYSELLTRLHFTISGDLQSLYAFHYSMNDDVPKSSGWHLYDTDTEYLRMGVPNKMWTLSNMNKNYEVSRITAWNAWS